MDTLVLTSKRCSLEADYGQSLNYVNQKHAQNVQESPLDTGKLAKEKCADVY